LLKKLPSQAVVRVNRGQLGNPFAVGLACLQKSGDWKIDFLGDYSLFLTSNEVHLV